MPLKSPINLELKATKSPINQVLKPHLKPQLSLIKSPFMRHLGRAHTHIFFAPETSPDKNYRTNISVSGSKHRHLKTLVRIFLVPCRRE